MKTRLAAVFAVTAALLVAGAEAAPIDKKETIRLDRAAIVGSSVLPSGRYQVELASDPGIVRFVRGGRTVAETPCKVGLAAVDHPSYALHFRIAEGGRHRLIKIVLADSKLAIEIPGPVDVSAK